MDTESRDFAQSLRKQPTKAERRLWSMLRHKQFAGQRFRRQQAIGPYVADFYCAAAKLIVELDGGQHGEDSNRAYDRARTRWLTSRGYRVVRFWNDDILKNMNGWRRVSI